jgi:hypothetical protein
VCATPGSVASSRTPEVLDEAVEATEAECARRAESSRVRRLTTASCSFSNSKCSSAAVNGLGCRIGTPLESTLGKWLETGLSGGNGCPC